MKKIDKLEEKLEHGDDSGCESRITIGGDDDVKFDITFDDDDDCEDGSR